MVSRWRVGALFVAVALLGACGGSSGDSSKKAVKPQSDDSDTTVSVGDSTTSSNPGLNKPGTSEPGSTEPTATTPTSTKSGATATTTKAATAPPPAAAEGSAPAPAKNGTYTYSQSGTTPDGPVPAQGTLVVNGTSFARFYDQSKQPQRLTYVFRSNGAFITGATLSFNGASATCSFGEGVAAPPWPPVVGSQSNKTGSCSTPVGAMTAVVSSKVTSRNGDIVGITTNVHVYNANRSIDVTANDVEGWSISLRVPKTSRQTFSGTAFGRPVNGDVSSTLTGTP